MLGSPEAVATAPSTPHVSLVQLITEARFLMRATPKGADSVTTWRQVISWLESKLPEGMTLDDLDDPMLSRAANEALRAAAASGADGLRRPHDPGVR